MTTAQVVETSVTVNKNSPIQDYVHPDDHTTYFRKGYENKMITKEKRFDLLWNCLNYFLTKMYGDQSGEFVGGYWESACMTV